MTLSNFCYGRVVIAFPMSKQFQLDSHNLTIFLQQNVHMQIRASLRCSFSEIKQIAPRLLTRVSITILEIFMFTDMTESFAIILNNITIQNKVHLKADIFYHSSNCNTEVIFLNRWYCINVSWLPILLYITSLVVSGCFVPYAFYLGKALGKTHVRMPLYDLYCYVSLSISMTKVRCKHIIRILLLYLK